MKKLLLLACVALTAAACGGQKGEKYREIAGLTNLEGVEVRLSTVVEDNEYTLLDFWASWCPPCMAELPFLKATYDKYHDQGFEIYGVSYDENEAAWTGAIIGEGMNWIHVSSVRGWECPTQELYGVNAIPRNYLIDRKGNIVAMNLRGDALEAKLAELMN
ncbi:MAG: TlpA family protein disulfide reductase [Alistipes sp.]|jgi:thiol-disulfide isomerase/thioredoxin|nr:TlpA family protein disulfide reductase [Alistipes sp.]